MTESQGSSRVKIPVFKSLIHWWLAVRFEQITRPFRFGGSSCEKASRLYMPHLFTLLSLHSFLKDFFVLYLRERECSRKHRSREGAEAERGGEASPQMSREPKWGSIPGANMQVLPALHRQFSEALP